MKKQNIIIITPYAAKIYIIIFIILIIYGCYYRFEISASNKQQENFKNNIQKKKKKYIKQEKFKNKLDKFTNENPSVQEYVENIKELEAKINTLKQQLKLARHSNNNKNNDLDSKTNKITKLELQLEQSNKELQEYEKILTLNGNETIKKVIKLLQEQRNILLENERLTERNRKLEEKQTNIASYKSDVQELEEARKELQDSYEKLIDKEKLDIDKAREDLYKPFLDAENAKLEKYNKALTDYIQHEKDKKLQINLLDVGEYLHDGVINLFDELDTHSTNTNNNTKNIETFKNKASIKKKINNNKDNFVSEEEEESNENITISTPIKLIEKENVASNKYNSNPLMGFMEYSLEQIYNLIYNNDNPSLNNIKNKLNLNSWMKLLENESNLIPLGVIFIFLSLCLYFIDITS